MNFKRHWDAKPGCTTIYSAETAECKGLEIDMLKLEKGKTFSSLEKEKEVALIILGGTIDICGDGFEFKAVGKRKDVFDGKAYAAYIPMGKNYTLTGVTDAEVVIAKCPAKEEFEPVLVTPDDVVVKNLGKPGFEREAHFIIDERLQANKIYIGENFIKGGQWSSYPGHKHDEDNMPTEGFAEEIYFYKYDKKQGFGIQKVYTYDKEIDETYTTYENDFVEMPKGYHPCTVAPGYNGYLLWLMCCDHRGFFMTTDPDHAWLND